MRPPLHDVDHMGRYIPGLYVSSPRSARQKKKSCCRVGWPALCSTDPAQHLTDPARHLTDLVQHLTTAETPLQDLDRDLLET